MLRDTVDRGLAFCYVSRSQRNKCLLKIARVPSTLHAQNTRLSPELGTQLLQVHEVADAAAVALGRLVLATAGLAKVCDRRELGDERAAFMGREGGREGGREVRELRERGK